MLVSAGIVEPTVRRITGPEAAWVAKLRLVDGLTAFKS